MFPNINSVILGGIGGLLPTTAQLAAFYAAHPEQDLPHWHILIAIALFFSIGAVLSVAFNRDADLGKAIVIGISAPAIITNILNGASPAKPAQPTPPIVGQIPNGRVWLPVFTSTALADQGPQSTAVASAPPESKSIVLTTAYVGQGQPGNGLMTITAIQKDATTRSLGTFGLSQFAVVPVPSDTEKLVIQVGNNFSKELELWPQANGPPSFAVNVRLIAKTTGAGDFLWALGAARQTTPISADITTLPLSSYAPPTITNAGVTTCNNESKLLSLSGDRSANITFANDSTAVRKIYWLNYSGQRVLYQTLQPGQQYTQPTYITHPWVVTDNDGVCKAIIVAQQPSTAFQIGN